MWEGLSEQEKMYFLDFVLSAVLFLLLVWNVFQQWSLNKSRQIQKAFLKGKKGADLEQVILEQKKEIETLKRNLAQLGSAHSQTNKLAFSAIHQVGMIRFNPFRDIGGDQSFSLALLNGQKDGVVISSLYSREGVRVYSKAIQNGQAVKYPLTNEEKNAIDLAVKNKNVRPPKA